MNIIQLLKSHTVQFALLAAILGVLRGFVFLLPMTFVAHREFL